MYGALRAAAVLVVVLLGSAQAAEEPSVAGGARTWANNCDRCHEMRDPLDFDADQWRVIVAHMRIRAGLTGGESRDVLKFLQQSGAREPVPARSGSRSETGGSVADGKRIYEGTCVACHGADGRGALRGVPDFAAPNGPLSQPDAVLLEHVERGFQSPSSPMAMPPKGGDPALGEAELKAVLQYMRATFAR